MCLRWAGRVLLRAVNLSLLLASLTVLGYTYYLIDRRRFRIGWAATWLLCEGSALLVFSCAFALLPAARRSRIARSLCCRIHRP